MLLFYQYNFSRYVTSGIPTTEIKYVLEDLRRPSPFPCVNARFRVKALP